VPRTPAGDRSRSLEAAILQRVDEQGDRWFPDLQARENPRLALLSRRPRAVLYGVHLDPTSRRPQVLAKVRSEWAAAGGVAGRPGARPRLQPPGPGLDTGEATALEFAALQEIHAIFAGEPDGLTSVRPLDHLVAENTILMDYVDGTTLRQLLVRQSRLSPPWPLRHGVEAMDVWRAAGSWLRTYQQRMPPGGREARQATRGAVVDRFDAFGDFLAHRLGRPAVGDTARRAIELAEETLPAQLSMAVNHGDYAPRNIFLRADGRLAAFDPLPRWLAPRYEDLARFLVAIRLSGSQVHTHGAAYAARELDRREEAVIAGYRGDAALSLPELRCYQLLITLDRWSALVGPRPRGRRQRVRAAPVELASGYVHREAERLLGLIDSSRATSRAH